MELDESMVHLNQSFKTKEDAIRKAGEILVEHGKVTPAYIEAMLERDNIVSTYMGNFVAIPHGTDEAKAEVKQTGISVLQIPFGVNFDSNGPEEKMAMMVFGIAGVGNEHLDLLSKIAVVCADVQNVERLVNAESTSEIKAIFEEAEL